MQIGVPEIEQEEDSMHDDDPRAVELLILLKRLQGEMKELFDNIKQANETMVKRLEKSVQAELKSQEKRIEQFAQGQGFTPEQGPASNPDRKNQDYERHSTTPR